MSEQMGGGALRRGGSPSVWRWARAVTAPFTLRSIWEGEFLEHSYEFRPGRSALHKAANALSTLANAGK